MFSLFVPGGVVSSQLAPSKFDLPGKEGCLSTPLVYLDTYLIN
jgi:hypothetical protein